MSIVILTRPDGNPIAINSSQWHTVTADTDGAAGHNTQVGFSGTAVAVHVKETFDAVLKKLDQADKV